MDSPNNIYTAYTPGSGAECVEVPVPEGFVCNNDTNSADHDIAFFVLTEEPCRQGCCKRYECDGNDAYVLVSETASSANCTYPIAGVPLTPCADIESPTVGYYNTWTEGACPTECNNVFLICEGFSVNEPGWQPPPPPYAWILNPNTPNNSCNAGCTSPVIGTACNNYGDGQEEPCSPSGGGGALSWGLITHSPCSQEECEAHVSTWMAEPSGEPNEAGLYKVKWILLDGCPGACCSDQPTQPEFVKTSTLIDAPCKCGCN